jgi:hypothetical protein
VKLIAPNGKLIVGTAESMLVTQTIEVLGREADGSISFEYTGDATDHGETCEQRKNRRGKLLYTDTDGFDWPEHKLKIVADEAAPADDEEIKDLP